MLIKCQKKEEQVKSTFNFTIFFLPKNVSKNQETNYHYHKDSILTLLWATFKKYSFTVLFV